MAENCENCGSIMTLRCNAEVERLKLANSTMLKRAVKLGVHTAKLRTSNNEIFEKNKELKAELEKKGRVIVQVREQCMNIAKQLGRNEENLMKLRNKFAVKTRELHALQSQLVWLAEWCQKKFGIIIGEVLGKGNTICKVVAKIVDCDSKQKQIGWYNPKSGALCRLLIKEALSGGSEYTQPVYIKESDE